MNFVWSAILGYFRTAGPLYQPFRISVNRLTQAVPFFLSAGGRRLPNVNGPQFILKGD